MIRNSWKPPDPARQRRYAARQIGNLQKFNADVRNFARWFSKVHAAKWERNPRLAREMAVWFLRRYLPKGRPGRPRSSDVTSALLMREQGKRWTEIYAVLIPDRDLERRTTKQSRLRAAVRSRARHAVKKHIVLTNARV
jgi:hypothetical protein